MSLVIASTSTVATAAVDGAAVTPSCPSAAARASAGVAPAAPPPPPGGASSASAARMVSARAMYCRARASSGARRAGSSTSARARSRGGRWWCAAAAGRQWQQGRAGLGRRAARTRQPLVEALQREGVLPQGGRPVVAAFRCEGCRAVRSPGVQGPAGTGSTLRGSSKRRRVCRRGRRIGRVAHHRVQKARLCCVQLRGQLCVLLGAGGERLAAGRRRVRGCRRRQTDQPAEGTREVVGWRCGQAAGAMDPKPPPAAQSVAMRSALRAKWMTSDSSLRV